MNPQANQPSNPQPQDNNAQQSQIKPDDAAANLSLATHIQDTLLTGQHPGNPRVSPPSPETNQPQGGDIKKEIESVKTEMQDMIKKEMDGLRNDIKSALDEEDNQT